MQRSVMRLLVRMFVCVCVCVCVIVIVKVFVDCEVVHSFWFVYISLPTTLTEHLFSPRARLVISLHSQPTPHELP